MPRHKRSYLGLQRGKHVQSGLVLSFPFNERNGDPQDHSGRSNHATINSATWSDTPYGDGLTFNGSSDYMTFPGADYDFTSEDFSIAARVYINALNANGVIAANGSWNTDGWWFTIGNDGGLALWTFTPGAYAFRYANAATVATGNWYSLIVIRRKGHAVHFHVNGNAPAAGDQNDLADCTSTSGAVIYTAKRPDSGQYADITMTDLRIYNRVLDYQEVRLVATELG